MKIILQWQRPQDHTWNGSRDQAVPGIRYMGDTYLRLYTSLQCTKPVLNKWPGIKAFLQHHAVTLWSHAEDWTIGFYCHLKNEQWMGLCYHSVNLFLLSLYSTVLSLSVKLILPLIPYDNYKFSVKRAYDSSGVPIMQLINTFQKQTFNMQLFLMQTL